MAISGISFHSTSTFNSLRPFLTGNSLSEANIKRGPFGNFSIANNVLRFTPNVRHDEPLQNYALIKKKPANRFKASLDVSLTDYSNIDNKRVGLVLNHQDKDNYLMMTIDSLDKKARLIKMENGKKVFLQATDLKKSPGKDFNLQVEVNTNSYNFFINGEKILSTKDSSFSGGEFGFAALDGTATFSNLEILSS